LKTEREANLFMLVFIVYEFVASLLVGIVTMAAGMTGELARVALLQGVTFLLPCVVLLALRRWDWRSLFPFCWIGWKNILFILIMMLCAQPVMMFLSGLSAIVFGNQVAETVSGMMQSGGLAVTVLVVGFVPAVLEEAVFRGVVFSGYKNAGLWTAALVNGLFFGIMHLNIQQFLYAFCMGALFALMVRHTRSLLASMLAHSAVNVSQTFLAYSAGQAAAVAVEPSALSGYTPEMETVLLWLETNAALVATLFMLVVSVFAIPAFVLVYRAFARHNAVRNAGECAEPVASTVEPAAKPFNWSFWCVVGIFVLYTCVAWLMMP